MFRNFFFVACFVCTATTFADDRQEKIYDPGYEGSPYRFVGPVISGNNCSTGAMVGPRLVLTVAHLAYDRANGLTDWPRDTFFYPGASRNQEGNLVFPFGKIRVIGYGFQNEAEWKEISGLTDLPAKGRLDWMVLVLEKEPRLNWGGPDKKFGCLKLTTDVVSGEVLRSIGYPAYNGGTLQTELVRTSHFINPSEPWYIRGRIDDDQKFAGMSGAPLLRYAGYTTDSIAVCGIWLGVSPSEPSLMLRMSDDMIATINRINAALEKGGDEMIAAR